jgi:EAL domain-containing protein (putative c-di-GMP-specific phosphodiesterase class I)
MNNKVFSREYSAASPERRSSESQQNTFISNLRYAIDNDELSLHYQPRFHAISGKADILEALVRWHRPGIGRYYPGVFIPDAEENGLIFSLDLWVFERCCKDLKRLQATINPPTFQALPARAYITLKKLLKSAEIMVCFYPILNLKLLNTRTFVIFEKLFHFVKH